MKIPSKQEQRSELRRKLAENAACDPRPVVSAIADYLSANPAHRVVAVYSAMPGEVDLKGLLTDSSKTWVFPKVSGEILTFHRVTNVNEDLQTGAYGILEPKSELEEISIQSIDLFLCPGLGFDRSGGRIGRGKGFYDRMLKRARPDAIKLGVCFPFQIVAEILMEGHDFRMDLVLSGCPER